MNPILERTVKAVAEVYGLQVEDLKLGCRKRPRPEARRMVCYLLFGKVKTQTIQEYIGYTKTHAVSMCNYQMIDELKLYKEVQLKLSAINKKLNYQ